MSLLMYLDSCGYSATGTMRENRIPKNCPIKPVKSMKKEKRGVFEYATTKVDGSSVIITRWMDNSVVTVASTCHGVNPITSAKRYSVAEKKTNRHRKTKEYCGLHTIILWVVLTKWMPI
nr:unnamed protein product [Callosobruchus chinensis]